MLVFATSDKGGTGRSVTSSNILYRIALTGADVSYLDFDFGSPTAGSVFAIDSMSRGTDSKSGMHSYLLGRVPEPEACDIWQMSDRGSLRHRPPGAGRMVLMPGDAGGAEFSTTDPATFDRCRDLFLRLEEEFEVSFIDLSAGRSYALTLVLSVLGDVQLFPDFRWLVFHRWTRQHVLAAGSLVHGERGILDTAEKLNHSLDDMTNRIRFVRTAVVDPNAPDMAGLRPAQLAWLQERNRDLGLLAGRQGLGRAAALGSVPIDPMLQWHEQLLTDKDVFAREVANPATVKAFTELSERLRDDAAWEPR